MMKTCSHHKVEHLLENCKELKRMRITMEALSLEDM